MTFETPKTPAKVARSYAFRGWTLYSRTVVLNPGLEKTVYFFSKDGPAQGEPADLPVGYRATMGRKTGVPFLTRIGEDRTPWARGAQGLVKE